MGYISLIIGLAMIYFMLNFKSNQITKNDSLYDTSNKIGIWAFAVLFIITGTMIIIKDIIHFFSK